METRASVRRHVHCRFIYLMGCPGLSSWIVAILLFLNGAFLANFSSCFVSLSCLQDIVHVCLAIVQCPADRGQLVRTRRSGRVLVAFEFPVRANMLGAKRGHGKRSATRRGPGGLKEVPR